MAEIKKPTVQIVHRLYTQKPIVKLDDNYVLSYEEDILDIDEIIPLYKLIDFIDEYAPELIRKKSKVTINSKPLSNLLEYRVGNVEEIDEFIKIHNDLNVSLSKEKLNSFIYGDKKEKAKSATQFHALQNSLYGRNIFHTFEKNLNNITDINYKFKLVIETLLGKFKPQHEEFIEVMLKAEINMLNYPLYFYIPTNIVFEKEDDLEKIIHYTLGQIQNKVLSERPELLSFLFDILSIKNINIKDLKEDGKNTFVLILADADNNITTPFIRLHKIFLDDSYDPINKLENVVSKIAKNSIKNINNFYNHAVKRSSSYIYGFEINILKNYSYIKGEKKQLYDATLTFSDNKNEVTVAVEYSINSRYPNKMLPVHMDVDTVDTQNRIYNEVLTKVHKSFNEIFNLETTMDLEIYKNMKEYLRCFPFKDEPIVCYKIAAVNVSIEVFSILIYFSVDELSKLIRRMK